MRLYPESAGVQLEFDKVKQLLRQGCQSAVAKDMADNLRIHTHAAFIEQDLKQTYEMKLLRVEASAFPNDFFDDISKELKLITIPGAILGGEQWLLIRHLCINTESVYRWFNPERREAFAALNLVIQHTDYDKKIITIIDEILDEKGQVKDTASADLQRIRLLLYKARQSLSRAFEKVLGRLAKAGYTADIDESFSNGRRVVAVFAEHKRQVKGILHGESDTGKTTFIEPEETIELNNAVFAFEQDEQREIVRILRALTANIMPYGGQLQRWADIAFQFDFINAKAKLAVQMEGQYPNITKRAYLDVKQMYHPLLLLYNRQAGKATQPITIKLDDKNRILVISGPNAGGKTVTMKTIGLCQLMLQSGLLIPVNPTSEMGIFKQLFIHIGDTQSLEFDLSTYSSHLIHMKYFTEWANGKTLFFIDELGSGSDPHLGGAFAEVILQELNHRHAMGVVTTHYLNLKVMANHTAGIVNGCMAFDEQNLLPLYKLVVGKPGSSYTFSIAERIGLPRTFIEKARKLVDEDHFRLDKLLNRTEQDLQYLEKEKKELSKLVNENEKLHSKLHAATEKEKHKRQVEILAQQNKIKEDRIQQFQETERKLKQAVKEWKGTADKEAAVKEIERLLLGKKEKQIVNKLVKKMNEKYVETADHIAVGAQVKLKKNHQVGTVLEIRGKRAIVKIGMLPMNVDQQDLVVVAEKVKPVEES